MHNRYVVLCFILRVLLYPWHVYVRLIFTHTIILKPLGNGISPSPEKNMTYINIQHSIILIHTCQDGYGPCNNKVKNYLS